MAGAVTPSAAKQAKEALRAEFGTKSWFRGVGIVPSDGALALRLNVDPNADVAEGELPDQFQGIRVEVIYISEYEAR